MKPEGSEVGSGTELCQGVDTFRKLNAKIQI